MSFRSMRPISSCWTRQVHASFENRCLHERVTIEKGEGLLLHTDGITEAADEREEFYDVHFPLQRTS